MRKAIIRNINILLCWKVYITCILANKIWENMVKIQIGINTINTNCKRIQNKKIRFNFKSYRLHIFTPYLSRNLFKIRQRWMACHDLVTLYFTLLWYSKALINLMQSMCCVIIRKILNFVGALIFTTSLVRFLLFESMPFDKITLYMVVFYGIICANMVNTLNFRISLNRHLRRLGQVKTLLSGSSVLAGKRSHHH